MSKRVSLKAIEKAIGDYAIKEANRFLEENVTLWYPRDEVMNMIRAYGKQRERDGRLRGFKEGCR